MAEEYLVTYRDDKGVAQVNADKAAVLRLIQKEVNERTPVGDSRVYNYGFKIDDIYSYSNRRDLDFFAPGVSKADKYCNKVHGYFIKDVRTNFKALAPGTDKVLIFDTKPDAEKYFFDNQLDIAYDYEHQRDFPLNENNVIYESVVDRQLSNSYLDLSGKGDFFPWNDIYTTDDVRRLLIIADTYDTFHQEHEYAQLLTCNRVGVADFINRNAQYTPQGNVFLDFDKYDKDFKSYVNRFVQKYPELVNDSIDDMENYFNRVDAIRNAADDVKYQDVDLSFD